MIRSALIKFESWIKCAELTVPLIGRKCTTHTQTLAFEIQSTVYLTQHLLTYMLLYQKRGLQS